jgi:hypothetical protein
MPLKRKPLPVLADSGYWILDTGYWILDTGYWILDVFGLHY